MAQQLSHSETAFVNKTFPITLVCDHVYFQDNIGSVFRISEAFGVSEIIFIGENLPFTPRKINKTSRSTHQVVPYRIVSNMDEIKPLLENPEVETIALEIADSSQPIQRFKPSKNALVLMIGSEIHGLDTNLLALANSVVHIPMYGKNSSMNVVQATGICLYELTNALG